MAILFYSFLRNNVFKSEGLRDKGVALGSENDSSGTGELAAWLAYCLTWSWYRIRSSCRVCTSPGSAANPARRHASYHPGGREGSEVSGAKGRLLPLLSQRHGDHSVPSLLLPLPGQVQTSPRHPASLSRNTCHLEPQREEKPSPDKAFPMRQIQAAGPRSTALAHGAAPGYGNGNALLGKQNVQNTCLPVSPEAWNTACGDRERGEASRSESSLPHSQEQGKLIRRVHTWRRCYV